ncbi:hypothetical protein BMS3Bbin06_01695 [bacterium BMS3Bbin06]|nr:hypothetical protein BMS3Bbin06_01695 [bacterium BMS3Bbin06]
MVELTVHPDGRKGIGESLFILCPLCAVCIKLTIRKEGVEGAVECTVGKRLAENIF